MSIKNNIDELLTADVIRYLKQLSKLYGDDVVGNAKLHEALIILTSHLNKYSSYPISEAISLIEKRTINKKENTKKIGKQKIQINYQELTQDQIKNYLNSNLLTKDQFIEIGHIKYGIPKSGMLRLNRNDIIDRIKSALAHSDSISIISDAAKDSGKYRKS